MTDVNLRLVCDVARAETSAAVYRAMLAAMEAHLPADAGGIGRETEGEVTVVDSFGDTPTEQNPRMMQPVCEVYSTGQPCRIDDLTDTRSAAAISSDSPVADDRVYRSFLGAPVGEEGVVYAVATSSGVFSAADVEWMSELAAIATAALERIHDSDGGDASADRTASEELVGTVAHDLRNPLMVATGNLELIRAEGDTEELQDLATALDRIEAYVNDLLRFSHAGSDSLEMSTVDLSVLVNESWHDVETGEATVACEVERSIRADPTQLRRFLENLFQNAVEHGDATQVTVGPLEKGFFIADDGIGIPADLRERVFETGYSTRAEGTGFGLNIVKRIANAHNWAVRVTDSDKGGVQVEITGVEFADG